MRIRLRTMVLAGAVAAALAASARPVHAGCGCDKAPPPPSPVRPAVTYAGAPVTLFSSSFQDGEAYSVTFTGLNGESTVVDGRVDVRRDLADGAFKPQLVVGLPPGPLGPTSIAVSRPGTAEVVLFIDDAAFTATTPPVSLPTVYGAAHHPDYRAAVGRDGVIYIALDLGQLTQAMVFRAQGLGLPLRFSGEDVTFYNRQGFLMQRLVSDGEPVPGMFVFPSEAPSEDSDTLYYSRHEFVTYFLQHAERQPHAVDATGEWHLDGTPHIDHDHMILAIAGRMPGGMPPAAGATPPFDLVVTTSSLFHYGVAGSGSIAVVGDGRVDGFDPADGSYGPGGDVLTNGAAVIKGRAVVDGDATGANVTVTRTATLTGQAYAIGEQATFMEVKVPRDIPSLGDVRIASNSRMTIAGPGSFQVGDLALAGRSTLEIDNAQGPVTLYVTGDVTVGSLAKIAVSDPDPERFAVYVAGRGRVSLAGSRKGRFYGVIYAPRSRLAIHGGLQFYGAFVGRDVSVDGLVHYDRSLRSTFGNGSPTDVGNHPVPPGKP